MNSQGKLGGMSPPIKRHLELEIKALQNAPRDADKLERLLQVKQRQKEEALHIDDTQRLVTEIEMLKVVLYLVMRKR
jgi:methyl coenzyme M reductase beta subunit